MNQDFTVKKKQYLPEKKKFVQRGSPEKNIPAQAVGEKKKFVQVENSPPPPPHHFSNGPSLNSVLPSADLEFVHNHPRSYISKTAFHCV